MARGAQVARSSPTPTRVDRRCSVNGYDVSDIRRTIEIPVRVIHQLEAAWLAQDAAIDFCLRALKDNDDEDSVKVGHVLEQLVNRAFNDPVTELMKLRDDSAPRQEPQP